MIQFCYTLVTSLIYSYLNAPFIIVAGVVVACFSKIWVEIRSDRSGSSFFYAFGEIFCNLLLFCYTFIEKTCNTIKASNFTHVTKCNKNRNTPGFVTICYTLLQQNSLFNIMLLHFVTPQLIHIQMFRGCNKCNSFYLATNSQYSNSSFSEPLTDKNGRSFFLVNGTILRSANRIFQITEVWHIGTRKESFELTEFLFPEGWDQILQRDLEKIEGMKNCYPKKVVTVSATTLITELMTGRIFFY